MSVHDSEGDADMANLEGKRIAFLATEGVEQEELARPLQAAREAGASTSLINIVDEPIKAFKHLDRGDEFPIDATITEVSADSFDGLVLPGGVANPDRLRTDRHVVAFVRSFFENDKPVAAICHGPWTLVEANVVKGRTVTSWPSLKTDLNNAGAHWVDRKVQVDGNLVTSRKPEDLTAFCDSMLAAYDDEA
jgi:deglycase